MRGLAAVGALLAVIVASCGRPASSGSEGWAVKDSAGIEVVSSGVLEGKEFTPWQVVPRPVLQIGSRGGEASYLFMQVKDGVRLPDGRVVVSDWPSGQVRIFGPSGEHETTFGGRGEGPREFGGPPWLALAAPDTLIVWDGGRYRLTKFDTLGHLLHEQSLLTVAARLSIRDWGDADVWQTESDGSILSTAPGDFGRREGRGQATEHVVFFDGSGTSFDFGEYALQENYSTGGFGFMNDFAPRVATALGRPPFRVAIAAVRSWEIRFFDQSGALKRILRAPIPRTRVTDGLRAERRAGLRRLAADFRLPKGTADRVEGAISTPDSLPAIASLRWDQAGELWVGRRIGALENTRRYDVFSSDGRWLNTVDVPPELGRILEIGDDYVLTAWRDDLGVQYVRVYQLEKGAP